MLRLLPTIAGIVVIVVIVVTTIAFVVTITVAETVTCYKNVSLLFHLFVPIKSILFFQPSLL